VPAAKPKDDFAWIVGAVAVLALAVRTLYLLSIHRAIFFDHLVTEPARYDAWSWDIVRGAAPVRPPFDEAPGYPYFVALVYAVAGRSHMAVATVQALVDAGSCAAVAVVARRLAGARAGALAGGLLALFAPAIYFTGQLEPATWTVAAVSLWLLATPFGPARDRRMLLYGGAFAFGLFMRSELLAALPLVLVHAALVGGKRALVWAAVAPTVLLAASLTINCASSGHLVVTTTGSGANLWIGNRPAADGVSPFVQANDPVVREVEQRADDAVAADSIFRQRALQWMAEHPTRTASLALRKLAWTFSNRELPNASDIEWETRHSWLFVRPLFPLGFGVLLPLALAGVVVLDRRSRSLVALGAPIFVVVVVAVAFFTNARFRMAMAPPVVILAGIGATRTTAARWKPVVAALAAGMALAFVPLGGIDHYRIPEIDVNTAALEIAEGHDAQAVERLRMALAAAPDDAMAWVALASTLERTGRLNEAATAWGDAQRALPLQPDITAKAQAFRVAHPTATP